MGEGAAGVGEGGRLEGFVKRIYTFYTGFPRKGVVRARRAAFFGLARLVLFCWAWGVRSGRSRIKITTIKKVGKTMIRMIEKVLGQVADYTLGTFDFDISESELVASYGYRARSV